MTRTRRAPHVHWHMALTTPDGVERVGIHRLTEAEARESVAQWNELREGEGRQNMAIARVVQMREVRVRRPRVKP